jgi:Protein of unknown function (DUF1566)
MSRAPASASTSEASPGAMRAFVVGLAAAAIAASAAWAGGALAQQVCNDGSGAPDGRSSPSSRFIDNADGTVTDKESKLMWLHCSAGQTWMSESGRCAGEGVRLSWAEAQALASDVNRRGSFFFNDWRVPQLRELATIAERGCANPRVNLAVFPGTEASRYWTVTSRPGGAGTRGDEAHAYALSFGAEGVAYRSKDETHRVRLVRSTQ